MKETHCNSKLSCLFQMLSHSTTSSSEEKKPLNYTKIHKASCEDCENISLELALPYYLFSVSVLLLYVAYFFMFSVICHL